MNYKTDITMMMKVRKVLFLCAMMVVACAMTSCLDNVKSDYTPRILMSAFYVNPYYENGTLQYAQDTLYVHYDDKAESNVTDTMQFGDTVMVGLAFDALGNSLVATRIEWDTTALKAWLGVNETIIKALSDTTGIRSGYLPFNPAYNVLSFPLFMVPQKAGSHAVKMTVETDSKYSPVSAAFSLIVD